MTELLENFKVLTTTTTTTTGLWQYHDVFFENSRANKPLQTGKWINIVFLYRRIDKEDFFCLSNFFFSFFSFLCIYSSYDFLNFGKHMNYGLMMLFVLGISYSSLLFIIYIGTLC